MVKEGNSDVSFDWPVKTLPFIVKKLLIKKSAALRATDGGLIYKNAFFSKEKVSDVYYLAACSSAFAISSAASLISGAP